MVAPVKNIAEFLDHLTHDGIDLWVEDGRLRSRAKKGAISRQDADFIRAFKPDIIEHLAKRAPVQSIYDPSDEAHTLSIEQLRLWRAIEVAEPGDAYNVPLLLHIHGHLDLESFEDALLALLKRHTILRSVFVEDTDGSVRAQPRAILKAPLTHIESHPILTQDDAMAMLLSAAKASFDLRQDIPIRCVHLAMQRDSYLCVVFHHIVVDAESVTLLLAELSELYRALVEQDTPRLSPQAVQYSVYAAWQQERLTDPAYLESAERYREEQSQSYESAPCLLPDIGHRDQPPGACRRYEADVPSDLRSVIDAIARQHKLTPFALLQAVVSLYLSEISDATDFTIASPVSTRDATTFAGTVGYFVNILTLRHIPRQAQQSLDDYLPAVRQRFIDAMRFRHVPVGLPSSAAGRVVDRAIPAMPPEVIFAFQSSGTSRLSMAGISIDALPVAPSVSKTDLVLYASYGDDSLGLSWEYDSARYTDTYMGQLIRGFVRFLGDIVRHPQDPIASASLVDAVAEPWLREMFIPARPRSDIGLVKAWRESVARHGDRIALIESGHSILYRDLDEMSDRYATRLMTLGISAGDRVGLLLPRSTGCVLLMLAIAKLGAAYVPVDSNLTEEAQRQILNSASIGLLVRAGRDLSYNGCKSIALEDLEHLVESDPASILPLPDSDRLLYVMFTSGSTGDAKGVPVSQDNVLAFADEPDYLPASGSIVAFCSLPSFDASTLEVWATLLNGHTLQIYAAERIDPPEFLDWMRESRIQVTFITSALFEVLMSLDDIRLPALTHLIAGGDVVSPDAIHTFRSANPDCLCMNGYGPTENTTFSTMHVIGALDLHAASIPIGRPVAGTGVAVVNASLQFVPPGHVGELVLTGQQLAKGYWNQPDLSAQRFVTRWQNGTRCYRTGDRVRWNQQGALEFVGRLDDQIKISGYRIELSDVRARLEAMPGIRSAVVLARKTSSGAKVIHAFYRPDTSSPSEEHIMAKLAATLPSYMVPSRVEAVTSFPLTRNGKVDHRRLLAQTEFHPNEALSSAMGWDRQVMMVWETILGRPCPDVDADFFALGGHSLTATRLALRLGELIGTRVPLGDVFRHATIRTQAAYCRRRIDSGTGDSALRRHGAKRAPLSFAQRRLWVLDQLGQGPAFNIPMAIRLCGELKRTSLQRALSALVIRHEILRTRYVVENDEPLQIIADDVHVDLEQVDCTLYVDPEQACQEMIAADAATPFDLTRDLMMRARLFLLPDNEAVLALNIHHIACDGWSMAILVDELSRLYAVLAGEQPLVLPALSVQYSDYAIWQRDHAQSTDFTRQLQFWIDRLANLPTTHHLPMDRNRPDHPNGTGDAVESCISSSVRSQLESFAQANETTPFTIVSAVFACLLARYSGDTDIAFGTPVANREQPGLGEQVGFFVNTLVLRTDLSQNPSLRTLVSLSKRMLADAFGAQSVPFETLVEVLQPERSANHSPLFQIMLSMHTNEQRDLQFPGIVATPIRSRVISAQYDLTVDVHVSQQGTFQLGWEFANELFDRATITRMASHFVILIERMLANPDLPFLQVPLLTADEVAAYRLQWTGPAQAVSGDTCIHHLIESQVAIRPQAIAVVHGQRRWTYQDVDSGANALAQRLLDAGVSTEQRVGLCVGRGISTIIGMLGILKSGAAYVPLEPDIPDARLREIIETAEITQVVVQPDLAERPTLLATTRVHVEAPATALDAVIDRPASSQTKVHSGVSAQNAAYVMFTSGSTGTPKGVVCEHRALVDRWQAWDRMLGLSEDPPVVLQMASLSVDICLGDMVKALASGGRLVLCTRDELLSPEDLWELMRREGVTFGDFVPSVLRALVGYLEANDLALSDVRHLMVGCEPWYGRDLHALQRVLGPRTRCFNIYGQTESIIDAAYLDVTELMLAPGDVLQIGVPLANTALSVCNPCGQLQPIGVAGELCVAGPALAREYLAQPELTREKFVTPDPSDEPHRRYRTGDIVKRLPDGRIAFVGRTDDQVKIRGYRVVLREVEEVMLSLPNVDTCIALAKPTASGDRMLVAYVTVNCPEHSGLVAQWRDALVHQMPDYMVPTAFAILDTIPMSTIGKVDRQKLLLLDLNMVEPTDHEPPQTPLEHTLADVWRAVLGLEKIGVLDNFFSIGGDSIRVVQLVAEARRHGVTFAARDIFTFQCIKSLAAHLDRPERSEVPVNDGNIRLPLERLAISDQLKETLPLTISDAYPATALQTMMLDKHSTHAGITGVYLPQQMFEFEDHAFNVEHLRDALSLLIAKHPILRAGFAPRENGGYLQVIRTSVPTPLVVVALDALPSSEQQIIIDQYVAEDLACPFELDREDSPLMRYALFDMGCGRWQLLMSTHHAIDDGWGFVEFMNELFALYERARSGLLPAALAPAPDVFRERVALELEAAACEHSATFWREHLATAPRVPAPVSGEKSTHAPRYMTQTVAITNDVLRGLSLNARTGGWQLKTATLLAYFHCLLEMTSQNVTVDVVSSGRSDRLSDPLHALGLFWSFSPIYFEADDELRSSQCKSLQALLISASEHVLYPIETLKTQGSAPSPWASFNFVHFHNMRATANQSTNRSAGPLRVIHESDRFHHAINLMVSLDKSAMSAVVTLSGNSANISANGMGRFLQRYLDILEILARPSDLRMSPKALPILQPIT